ncbi:MAG: biotin--[acetyl-CoA-carboxylase] ligase [Dysgonamonadaceae bacterium]|jgi:BirA family biotin operon repressor/biotin-[acetyl-CoA-carboxylase] ligase|nr:biotin--[acetyl-CoA-carboxylase] ligase [Dysgonamonadaceae bacterium]
MTDHVKKLPGMIRLPETESTSRYLEQLAGAGGDVADETLVVADFQTAGRGQPGNSWESEAGKNLTFSLLLYPKNLRAGRSFLIAELASLSVRHLLDGYIRGVTVKWPNDIYWRDRKICGILIENVLSGKRIVRSIIGIGLNVNQDTFLSDASAPVSLKQITGRSHDRIRLLEEFRAGFHRLRQRLESGAHVDELHREYMSALYRREGYFAYRDRNGCFEARIHHIEPSGHLILARKDGTLSRYTFKEVACL